MPQRHGNCECGEQGSGPLSPLSRLVLFASDCADGKLLPPLSRLNPLAGCLLFVLGEFSELRRLVPFENLGGIHHNASVKVSVLAKGCLIGLAF